MKGFVIADIETDVTYFALSVSGMPSSASQQWTGDPREALAFVRKKDAEEFSRKYLANMVYRIKEIKID